MGVSEVAQAGVTQAGADYVVYDVFTATRFGGNPLAVFPDAAGLPETQLQAIAREFNFSETTFVYPPVNPDNTARVRIFTPTSEVLFAGHPTIGTAIALHRLGRADHMVLELGVGPIACEIGPEGAAFTTPVPLEIVAHPPAELVARALGLPVEAIETANHAPVQASLGLAFVLVELRDRAALSAARPVIDAVREGAARFPAGLDFAIFCYCRSGSAVDARMFAPLDNVPEDPATGSASATLAALLAQLPGGPQELSIAQGDDMGRPSRISARVGAGGVTIAGQAVQMRNAAAPALKEAKMNSLTEWRAVRLAALTAEDGWLNLTDRIEIPAGPQRVGQGDDNDLILSTGPAHLGVLTLTAEGATFQLPGGEMQVFQPAPGGFPQLRVPPLLLELHRVDGTTALRVRDLTLPRRVELSAFPDDPNWIIRARWERLAAPEAARIGQRGGSETEVTLTHVARFAVQGHEIALVPTHWKAGQPMFVFRDATSGRETYGACRFLMGEDSSDSEITLDFNRAFTPPCGFTDFAICPLPPRQNILPFAVRAGETRP